MENLSKIVMEQLNQEYTKRNATFEDVAAFLQSLLRYHVSGLEIITEEKECNFVTDVALPFMDGVVKDLLGDLLLRRAGETIPKEG